MRCRQRDDLVGPQAGLYLPRSQRAHSRRSQHRDLPGRQSLLEMIGRQRCNLPGRHGGQITRLKDRDLQRCQALLDLRRGQRPCLCRGQGDHLGGRQSLADLVGRQCRHTSGAHGSQTGRFQNAHLQAAQPPRNLRGSQCADLRRGQRDNMRGAQTLRDLRGRQRSSTGSGQCSEIACFESRDLLGGQSLCDLCRRQGRHLCGGECGDLLGRQPLRNLCRGQRGNAGSSQRNKLAGGDALLKLRGRQGGDLFR